MTDYTDTYGDIFFMIYPKTAEARETCIKNKIHWFNSFFKIYSHAEARLKEIVEQTGVDGFCIAGVVMFHSHSKTDIEKQFKRLVKAQKRQEGVMELLADSDTWKEQKRRRAGTKRSKRVKEYAEAEGQGVQAQ